METIMVATDGSEAAAAAVRRAVDVALAEGARLIAVFVVPHDDWRLRRLGPVAATVMTRLVPSEHDRALEEAKRIARERSVEAQTIAVADEDAVAGIVDVAAEVGPALLVVGSDGHGGLLGSHRRGLSEAVARRAHCGVLIAVRRP
jgi:nucleotide-binding universal stress UspA family protein